MVKAVLGDETQLKLTENRLTRSAIPSEVGLVIGKLSSKLDKGFVYDLVPTPSNDDGEPPCSLIDGVGVGNSKKKGSYRAKSQPESSTLFIDNDWVSEHARQVSRMLLGGMKVVGIYIWVNETSFKNSAITLCQTVKGVAEAASLVETDWNERLLIHISYSPLRWTCRNCSLAANISSSSLRPCDLKMGKVLGSLHTFRCMYNFDVRLPLGHEDGQHIRRFADILRHGITIQAKELRSSKALIDGKLVIEDELHASYDFHEVEFLLPFLQDKYVEACSQKEVFGVVLFSGSVCSLAYLNSKEPVSQALADIKEDIIMSLLSRLEMLCDEADRESESITDGGEDSSSQKSIDKPVPHLNLGAQSKQYNISFPRRVFVPWLEGTYICDYIQPSETVEVVKDHCVELMSMEAPTDASEILEPESEAPALITSTTKSFWDIAAHDSSASRSDNSVSKKSRGSTNRISAISADLNPMLAVLVVVLSIIVGLVLFLIREA
ncbi:oxidoreductase [Abeliophyllum distichum]|uniref:Oxidoreductase n=1 Tax=Abeliophyllum distichum TaxID=126358 RepID=A0ABD1SYM4_9LAMI